MVKLHLLGSLDLQSNGHALQSILVQPKRAALLAYLVLFRRQGAFVRRDSLLALFWPQLDAEHARGSLRAAIHRLRASLGEDVIISRGAEEIGIAADALWCDVSAFESAAEAQHWEAAAELYTGDLLDGFHITDAAPAFNQWVEQERARLRRLAAHVFVQASQACEARGEAEAALRYGQRAAGFALEHEAALRHLIGLLDRSGDRTGAIAAYDAFARRLRAEYDVEPAAETVALIGAVRARTQPGRAAGPPPERGRSQARAEPNAWRSKSPVWRLAAALVLTAIPIASITLLKRGENDRVKVATVVDGPVIPPDRAVVIRTVRNMDPIPRINSAGAYDAELNAALIFGGAAGRMLLNDVWRLENAVGSTEIRWTPLDAEGTPPSPRSSHAVQYDSVSDRLMVFGGALGFSSPCANDHWVLTDMRRRYGPRQWIEVQTEGAQPAARGEHAAVYAPQSNRLIVFGGHDCFQSVFNDVWVLTNANGMGGPSQWQQLRIAGPAPTPRGQHAAAYDRRNNIMIISGGAANGRHTNDVWLLANADGTGGPPVWKELLAADPRVRGPSGNHAAVYDHETNRLIVFGGAVGRDDSEHMWILTHANGLGGKARWIRVPPRPEWPSARSSPLAFYDERSDRLLLLSGATEEGIAQDGWLFANVRRLK